MTILEARNVTRTFGNNGVPVPVLQGVSLTCAVAESIAIMGKSGSGKSTLLHLLAGIDVPTSGEIWIDGKNLATMDDQARTLLRRRFIGLVFQAFNLLPNLSANENVALPLILDGKPRKQAFSLAAAALEMVGLAQRGTHLPSRLSGGEQQRVAIARALVIKPKLLVADEPTGNLDSHNSKVVTELLYGLANQGGAALILVTHERSVADGAQRVVRLGDGRIESDSAFDN